MALLFKRIKSAGGEVLLGITALITLVYCINFMYFGNCWAINGTDCTVLIPNGVSDVTNVGFGQGGPEQSFNGILMFGIFLSTMIILNEGARGMWKIMIPVLISLATSAIVINIFWNDASDSSTVPRIISPVITILYGLAYWQFMGEDEVNSGIEDFKMGIGVKDPIAMVGLGIVILTGFFYVFRQLVTPETVIDSINPGEAALGLLAPSKVTVAFTGALLLPYVLWALLVFTQGARGMWAVAHPALFAFLTVTIANYFGFVYGPLRDFTESNQMDAISGPATMMIFLLVYFKLRDEGIEDGMTLNGEPMDANGFNTFFVMVSIGIAASFLAVQLLDLAI